MWRWKTALENTIEEDRGQEFDEKSNDNPMRLVGKADTVDDDLDCDEDEGDEQLLEVEDHIFCIEDF